MRVVNTRKETITEYDLSVGRLHNIVIVKPDAVRIGKEITIEKNGKTIIQRKCRYEEDDFEEVQMYIPNYVPTAEERIADLKKKLSTINEKIIECNVCQIVGDETTYDMTALNAERQAIRDEINKLEQE